MRESVAIIVLTPDRAHVDPIPRRRESPGAPVRVPRPDGPQKRAVLDRRPLRSPTRTSALFFWIVSCSACAPSRPITGPGALPKEEIQQVVVRQGFGRFRLCYEDGLRRNPRLQGRVAVYFVIEADGSVTRQEDRGNDLPDRDVVACVVNGVGSLHFPPPQGGFVTVVYPIIFKPEN